MKKIEYSFNIAFIKKIVDTVNGFKLLPASDFEIPRIEGVVEKLTSCESLPQGDFFYIKYKPIPQYVLYYNIKGKVNSTHLERFPSQCIVYKLTPLHDEKTSDLKIIDTRHPNNVSHADLFSNVVINWLKNIHKITSEYDAYKNSIEQAPEIVNFSTDENFTETETEILRTHLARVISNAKERIRLDNKGEKTEIIEQQFKDITTELTELVEDTKTQTKFEWLKNHAERIEKLITKHRGKIEILFWLFKITVGPNCDAIMIQTVEIDFEMDINDVPDNFHDYLINILKKGVNSISPKLNA